ncbi:polymer-forming cytoskeletal protein [Hyphomicrobium sp.]|jgi:cytoskeletal protein CcmA (bactofilin family)|uniref:bactofilin family protein n=1 Tax=Hyphomicrobium sp. TaxID=82 RepID=UPI002CD84DE4|nr:polymer-forming cytoskeletal protein [Hyphomicrobium sp.]HVZ04610.1 polymer-forming cytoskeletal protein [Hyphomicrobium sp.]
MLPNFRRSDSETLKSQTTASALETKSPPPAIKPRSFLSVPQPEIAKSVSIIGSDLTIAGNLICKGEVQVDGIVEGDIEGSHVVVGDGATITGSISAEEIVIRGHVVGSVHGRRVMLQTTSQVEGDIYHQSLSIEQGAMFEGKSRRTKEDPRTMVKKSEPIGFVVPPQLPELAN